MESERGRSLAVRLLVTLGLPLAALAFGPLVTLPGVDSALFEPIITRGLRFDWHWGNPYLSVFALGLAPVVSAYLFVEVFALVVPPLARMRHGDPSGRKKLDRAARVLAMVLAVVQAIGVALSLRGLANAPEMMGSVNLPVVVASIVGGVGVLFLVASIVTRQGITNGIVLITALAGLRDLVGGVGDRLAKASALQDLDARLVTSIGAALVLPAVATWLALRRGDAHGAREATAEGWTPYRQAGALVLSPNVPIPASGIAPYTVAAALLVLPTTVSMLAPPFKSLATPFEQFDPNVWMSLRLLLTLGLGLLFAQLLHRPREMADLARRLGGGVDAEDAARRALRRALPGTLLLLAIVVVSNDSAGAGAVVVFLVAVVVDIALSVRIAAREPSLVSIWQERRTTALPVLKGALENEGISTWTRGTSVLAIFQAFAPYAAAELLVRAADAPRATAVLEHLLLGKDAPERVPREVVASTSALPVARRTGPLAVAFAVAVATFAFVHLHIRGPSSDAPTVRPELEVVRVDDDLTVLDDLRADALPDGIEIRIETVRTGSSSWQRRSFVSTRLKEGESVLLAAKRLRAALTSLRLPPGDRWAFEPTENYDKETAKGTVDGVRSFVLSGDPILTTADVVDAVPQVDTAGGDPNVSVRVTLSPDGSKRFAQATRESANRRIAIMLDGIVNSAPVVKSEINGGKMSITMGLGEPDLMVAQAKTLARALSGH